MPKATVTVEFEDGNSTTREISWAAGETPGPEDIDWLHAEITTTNEASN